MVSLNDMGEKLMADEFSIGETRFFVAKLPAMAAFDLLESIRHELSKSADMSLSEVGAAKTIGSLIKVVLSLNPAFVARVRRKLFEKVSFSNERMVSPQALAGAEDAAFSGLEPMLVYEVLIRCLAINFTASWQYAVSKFKDVDLTSIQSDLSE